LDGEFDPPPSPPDIILASGTNTRGFFVAKNLNGEIRGIPLKPNYALPQKVIR
jgi:hypothetical protein